MSDYNGCYVKLDNDPTFWAVDDDKKRKVANAEELYAIGLRPIVIVKPSVLNKIKMAKALPKAKANEENQPS